MKRVIGLIMFIVGIAISVGFNIMPFLDGASFLFVTLIGGSITLIEYKENFTRKDLIYSAKKNLIFSGWIGFIIGLILALGSFELSEIEFMPIKCAVALLPILYGYVFAYLAEFFNHD